MKILIVGLGSIGRRHAKNLSLLGGHALTVYDTNLQKAHQVQKEIPGLDVLKSLNAVQERQYHAALVCTPTAFHLKPARVLAQKGIPLLIEKPLSHSLAGVRDFLRLVKEKHLITMVGCNYRFHPGLLALKKAIAEGKIGKPTHARIEYGMYLPDWHPWEDYRKGYSAKRKLGGGVILDRIHEMDYATWLFGKPKEICGWAAKASSLEIEVEDNADYWLTYPKGFNVSIHIDYVRRNPHSSCEVIGEKGTVRWVSQENTVRLFRGASSEFLWCREDYDLNAMYVDEILYFLDCVRARHKSFYDAAQAAETLTLALCAKRSSVPRKVQKV